jgi:hypothetical protein
MGNYISKEKYNLCLICNEIIDTSKILKCINCDIMLHNHCEEKYRGYKKYIECPECHKIGSIAIINIK